MIGAVFIRRCMKVLEYPVLILEERLHLFEPLRDILEDIVLILEIPRYIRTFEIILEHFTFY